jgi:anti-sigma-K factor RskA
MDLQRHPGLIDALAGSYALGSLRGGARRRFETLARQHTELRVAALLWQERLAGFNELQNAVQPPAAVWPRIAQRVRLEAGDRAKAAATKAWAGWLRSVSFWRALSAAGALATVVAVLVGTGMLHQSQERIAQLATQLRAAPQVDYVAVLSDDRSNASLLVTFDPKNNRLTLQRVGDYREAGDRSLQLWALPPAGRPRSLGVLGSDAVLRLAAAEPDMQGVPTLAISLEPRGGVPGEGGPTGPVLFKGALIRKAL